MFQHVGLELATLDPFEHINCSSSQAFLQGTPATKQHGKFSENSIDLVKVPHGPSNN